MNLCTSMKGPTGGQKAYQFRDTWKLQKLFQGKEAGSSGGGGEGRGGEEEWLMSQKRN